MWGGFGGSLRKALTESPRYATVNIYIYGHIKRICVLGHFHTCSLFSLVQFSWRVSKFGAICPRRFGLVLHLENSGHLLGPLYWNRVKANDVTHIFRNVLTS